MNHITHTNGDEPDIFDDADALIALAQQSFAAAKREALAENDRLGVVSHGSRDGKLVARQPGAASATPR